LAIVVGKNPRGFPGNDVCPTENHPFQHVPGKPWENHGKSMGKPCKNGSCEQYNHVFLVQIMELHLHVQLPSLMTLVYLILLIALYIP
jgi:hypothetical protein